ncbi:MAG: hypothetical protein HY840_13685 [Bacteroidetes bacterium]|nr:hypothetical protein [Bacteroidota bacterium]
MAKKWSEKTEKATVVANDELLILDSEDANAATKNKRVKASLLLPPYKKYVALLTQTGTNPPTAIVLENTIGNIVWTYLSTGSYTATLANGFTGNVWAIIGTKGVEAGPPQPIAFANLYKYSNSEAVLRTYNQQNQINNDLLWKTAIEIRVYA